MQGLEASFTLRITVCPSTGLHVTFLPLYLSFYCLSSLTMHYSLCQTKSKTQTSRYLLDDAYLNHDTHFLQGYSLGNHQNFLLFLDLEK